ncbi:hypothetical protein HTV45_05550 [Streptomyces sp. CHD11]|uniref:hypothetical protein n=1 Tax=Streptomyces sp. CHD11 TaxID=2741325 RepID=UPI001BFCA06F|nr:hypothetical protein [Streptomyces sp. CHD11]MBT3150360.1 hypothetical protein [Streptomyces sp. CHD11]
MDAGVRSTANADLPAGCRRGVALAPVPKGPGASPGVVGQIASLTADGSRAVVLVPGREARRPSAATPWTPPASRERHGRSCGRRPGTPVRSVRHG